MSDQNSTSSSSSDEQSSAGDATSAEDNAQEESETRMSTNYLHDPWLLEHRKEVIDRNDEDWLSPNKTAGSSQDKILSEDLSSAGDRSSDEEESGTSIQSVRKHGARKTSHVPEWETNPQMYGLRRSSRQKREPERLLIEDESEDNVYHSKTSRHRKSGGDSMSTLMDTSSDDSTSEFESSALWKTARRKTNNKRNHPSKLRQLQAKLQGRKCKPAPRASGRRVGGRSKEGRSRRQTDTTTLSEDFSSDNNQPVRSSSRIQGTTVSYKENDSTQETDSDEVVAVEYKEETEGNELMEAVEKIMDVRMGRLGATGGKTTSYTVVELNEDPNHDFDADTEEGETQYLIKWSGRSHLHNTWESESTLNAQQARGMKRVENFIRKREQIDAWVGAASPEDREYYLCQQEMNRNVLESYRKVDRIFARSRTRNADGRWEYRVKWCGLPYSESTWEDEQLLITDFQSFIDEFHMRQENPCVPKRDCKVLRQRPRFVPMTRQPDWLPGKITLRDYQLEGVNWLAHSWCKGNSVILADEMGLGKTIQTISFLSYLYHTHELYGLFLIIVPLSTMTSWQHEFHTWAPFINLIVYMGDQQSRAIIRDTEWKFPSNHFKFNAVVTSYEILLKDKTFLGAHSWAVIAVDEAHRLKNDDSLLYKSLKEFKSNHRILITGTPLQNSLKELWALLHFIMPEKFDTWAGFELEHGQNSADSSYTSLHKVLQPFLLRRVKKDVEKSLPSKLEQILRIPMASLQKQYYKWILTKNYVALSRGRSGGRGGFSSFCNIIMELKKCCNHAYLIKPPEHDPARDRESALQNMLKSSGKMVLLDKLLLRLKEDGHRVLIFSQMVRMLDIIQEYLITRRLQFQRLDGSVKSDQRRRALDHFNAEGSDDFCFLLSTRAGGLGINLATADTVIIFDSDWNPMNDLQAQARAHRIGQKNHVNIYRLVCAGSVEEDIIERAKKKMVLDHLVIQRMDTSGKTVLFKTGAPSSTTNNPFNKDELTAILRFGAEELFQEAEGEDKEPECDIDDILRRAETRQEQTETQTDELLSAFKVATFNLDEDEPIEEAEQGKGWDEIIPESDRKKMEEEERLKNEAQLFLPPRQRKNLKVDAEASDSAGVESASDDDDNDDEVMPGRGRGGGRKLARGKVEWDDYVRGFNQAEVRRFIRSFRKFGDPLSRLDAIARDAELSEQSEADLRRLGRALHDRLYAMQGSEVNQDLSQETKEDGMARRGRGPSFRLAGVSVSVKTTLSCIQGLKPLVDVLPSDADKLKNFRLPIPVRPIHSWDCVWDVEDDSRLLIGIYEYGMGSWDQLQSDPLLQFDKKILRPNNEKPQARQLQSRAEYLIKALGRAQSFGHSEVTSPVRRRGQPLRDPNPDVPLPGADSKQPVRSTRNRKIRSKARVEHDDDSDVADELQPAAVASSNGGLVTGAITTDAVSPEITPPQPAKTKRKTKKRKVTNSVADSTSLTSSVTSSKHDDMTSEKRRKKNKEPSAGAAAKASGPIHVTANSDPVPVGKEYETLAELDPESFRDCKERLRPVKRALKQLDQAKAGEEGAEHTRRCLLLIGDRVIECLQQLHDPSDIRHMRRNLWLFVSKFTELNAEKLHKLYKSALKQRDHEIQKRGVVTSSSRGKSNEEVMTSSSRCKSNDKVMTPSKPKNSTSSGKAKKSRDRGKHENDEASSHSPHKQLRDAAESKSHHRQHHRKTHDDHEDHDNKPVADMHTSEKLPSRYARNTEPVPPNTVYDDNHLRSDQSDPARAHDTTWPRRARSPPSHRHRPPPTKHHGARPTGLSPERRHYGGRRSPPRHRKPRVWGRGGMGDYRRSSPPPSHHYPTHIDRPRYGYGDYPGYPSPHPPTHEYPPQYWSGGNRYRAPLTSDPRTRFSEYDEPDYNVHVPDDVTGEVVTSDARKPDKT